METKVSLPRVQQPVTCHYHEPDKSCQRPLPYALKLFYCCTIIRVTVKKKCQY